MPITGSKWHATFLEAVSFQEGYTRRLDQTMS